MPAPKPAPEDPVQGPLLVEAESFETWGGWRLDTQFTESMGSPFLLAHGLGKPVEDAATQVRLAPGTWTAWARTYDWVERWDAPGDPGLFEVIVDGEPLGEAGREGSSWGWRRIGTWLAEAEETEVRLRDRKGFGARVDALLFVPGDGAEAPGPDAADAQWRRSLNPGAGPQASGPYDLVIVGGGIAGTACAVSAARLGVRTALLQDRPVLGGNASSEVRVWMKGNVRRGPYPRIGEIVSELSDRASASPGTSAEFEDDKKLAIARAEPLLDLFLLHRVIAAEVDGEGAVQAVSALDIAAGSERRVTGRFFVDCTGDGVLGAMVGADHTMRAAAHLGASNMWRWEQADEPVPFPPTPWALQLTLDQFPYPNHGKGEWFWEGGFDRHPIDELETIRDANFRAVFGAFQAMKSGARAEEHERARLTWVAHVAGTRESRQLLGPVLLTQDDIVSGRSFPDGCVPTTWAIDLHVPKKRYLNADYPDDPFISEAQFLAFGDQEQGYPVPYRCFVSRNVQNLFMAGRCISVTHEALGTVRVMKTGGMMGEVVGKAASVALRRNCSPLEVASGEAWKELAALLALPGGTRRASLRAELEPAPSPRWTASGERLRAAVDPAKLPGLVHDDVRAVLEGTWTHSDHEAGFVGDGYLHDGAGSAGPATATFTLRARGAGTHRLGLAWRTGGNRASNVPVSVRWRSGSKDLSVDQREAPPASGFAPLIELELVAGEPVQVIVSNGGADGHVIVDAVQLVAAGE